MKPTKLFLQVLRVISCIKRSLLASNPVPPSVIQSIKSSLLWMVVTSPLKVVGSSFDCKETLLVCSEDYLSDETETTNFVHMAELLVQL